MIIIGWVYKNDLIVIFFIEISLAVYLDIINRSPVR